MAKGGVLGNGTKVGFSAASPVTYTKLGQLRDIPQFISLIANDVDTTVHSSSRLMTSMPGMIPPPEVKIQVLADLDQASSADQESLRTLQANGTTVWWLIEIPVDRLQSSFRGFSFTGYIREWTPDAAKVASEQLLNISIKYAGALIVTNAGASVLG